MNMADKRAMGIIKRVKARIGKTKPGYRSDVAILLAITADECKILEKYLKEPNRV